MCVRDLASDLVFPAPEADLAIEAMTGTRVTLSQGIQCLFDRCMNAVSVGAVCTVLMLSRSGAQQFLQVGSGDAFRNGRSL